MDRYYLLDRLLCRRRVPRRPCPRDTLLTRACLTRTCCRLLVLPTTEREARTATHSELQLPKMTTGPAYGNSRRLFHFSLRLVCSLMWTARNAAQRCPKRLRRTNALPRYGFGSSRALQKQPQTQLAIETLWCFCDKANNLILCHGQSGLHNGDDNPIARHRPRVDKYMRCGWLVPSSWPF